MASDFRALSIQQPWASAIAYGPKRVENRTWSAPPWIIGQTIALHASKGPDWDAPEKAWIAAGLVPYRYGDPRKAWTASLVLGAVVALAEVTGCHHATGCPVSGGDAPWPLCSPWAARGQFHIVLDHVRPLRIPVPCKGALGLWKLPADVELAVREQLEPKSITEKGSGGSA
jgi:hypothetical protein